MELLRRLQRLSRSDYFILARFLGPLILTTVAVDLGEQVLEPIPHQLACKGDLPRSVHEIASLSAEGERAR